jgi:hypothetical protein
VDELGDTDEDAGTFVRRLVLVAVVLTTVLTFGGRAWAANWLIVLHAGSHGEVHAQGAPVAPTGVNAACTHSTTQTVTLSWGAVAKATTYTIFDATSAAGTYASIASGVTTTSWTSATLSAANYWFEVAASTGANWLGTKSAATTESTTSTSGCVQP